MILRLRQEHLEQLDLFEGLLPPACAELPEPLAKLDAWLDDDRFFEPFQERYHARLGRPSVPAETYLRMAALQRQYDLSDRELCAHVQDRISWRRFCRIPWNIAVPHPSSLSKIRHRLDTDGGDHMARLNEHLVRKATEEGLLKNRKVRVDTAAVEANIHYPSDATLISDGIRVVTRLVKRIQATRTAVEIRFRDRTRTARRRLLEITKVLRRRTGKAYEEVRAITGDLAQVGQQVLLAAGQVLDSLDDVADATLQRLQTELELMVRRTHRVIDQALEVNAGNRSLPNRMVSVFDPDARPIPRGKRDLEFGFKVQLTENEQRVVTLYDVLEGNAADSEVVVPAVREHARRTGKKPRVVATDRGCTSADNQRTLQEFGIQQVCLAHRGRKSKQRQEHERQSWFRRQQRWRAGQEGTISLLKRRYGLRRTRTAESTVVAAGSEGSSGATTCSGSRPCCKTMVRFKNHEQLSKYRTSSGFQQTAFFSMN